MDFQLVPAFERLILDFTATEFVPGSSAEGFEPVLKPAAAPYA